MSKIDEIMGAVGRHGDDCIRDADAAPSAARSRRAMPCTTMATCAALLARCLSVVGVTR